MAYQETRPKKKEGDKMRLFSFAFSCLIVQMFTASFVLKVVGVSEPTFLLTMAISAHLVIEICRNGDLERCRGFFVFFTVYAIAEIYLFLLALTASTDSLYTVYSWLYDQGRSTMFTLTVISLLSGSVTPILNKTGRIGDAIGRFIDYCYSAVLRLPNHSNRG